MIERWIIQGKELTFEEEGHKYMYDGKPCISVTTWLKCVFKDMYKDIPEEVLKKASEHGTYVHESIEFYEKFGIENNELQEFRDYKFLKKYYGFEVYKIEIPIVFNYKGFILVGRMDLVLKRKDNKLQIVDIKTTSQLHTDYLEMQDTIYRLGYEQSYKEEIDCLGAIHLRRGIRKYVDIKDVEEKVYLKLDEYLKEKENER